MRFLALFTFIYLYLPLFTFIYLDWSDVMAWWSAGKSGNDESRQQAPGLTLGWKKPLQSAANCGTTPESEFAASSLQTRLPTGRVGSRKNHRGQYIIAQQLCQ